MAHRLEVNQQQRQIWNDKVIQYANHFLDNISEIPVYQTNTDSLKLLYENSFDEEGRDMDQLLEIIRQAVDSTGINPASPGHLGYVPGGGLYSAALGDFLAAVTNRYAGIFYANPGAVTLEDQCVRWMAELIGYPRDCAGNLTSGGSIATLTAMAIARDSLQLTPHLLQSSTIYLTAQAHHCILKALKITWLNQAQIRIVPMQPHFEMDVITLETMLEKDTREGYRPILLVGSAGTTDTGAIDPLQEIASLARSHKAWFHIDAAYGGFFQLLPEKKAQFEGMEAADSVVLDPHKGLFLPYGTGAVLIRNRQAALESMTYRANYMQDSEGVYEVSNPADVSPELTKHFRGLRMWLSLQLAGIAPFREALREKIQLALYFYEEVQKLGFETGPKPVLSICLFRRSFTDLATANNWNEKLTQKIILTGKIFISSTTINGVYWLRICVMVFRTHKENIDQLLSILKTEQEEL